MINVKFMHIQNLRQLLMSHIFSDNTEWKTETLSSYWICIEINSSCTLFEIPMVTTLTSLPESWKNDLFCDVDIFIYPWLAYLRHLIMLSQLRFVMKVKAIFFLLWRSCFFIEPDNIVEIVLRRILQVIAKMFKCMTAIHNSVHKKYWRTKHLRSIAQRTGENDTLLLALDHLVSLNTLKMQLALSRLARCWRWDSHEKLPRNKEARRESSGTGLRHTEQG